MRRVYLIETLIVLLLLLPTMGLATLATRPEELGFRLVAGAIIVHDVSLTALAAYLVWRSGEGIAAIGWKRAGIWREVGVGAALFVPLFVGIALLEGVLRNVGFPPPPPPPSYLLPQSDGDYLLALVLLVVVAVAEETIFRGYLLLRFSQVTGSRAAAVVLSSTIFAFGHAYQGVLGIVAVGLIGAAFAVIYLWRRSLVAPIVMHFIQNAIGLLIAPRLLT